MRISRNATNGPETSFSYPIILYIIRKIKYKFIAFFMENKNAFINFY